MRTEENQTAASFSLSASPGILCTPGASLPAPRTRPDADGRTLPRLGLTGLSKLPCGLAGLVCQPLRVFHRYLISFHTPRKSQPPILREAGGIVHISSRCLCCCQDFELSFSAANSLHVSQCIADAGLSSEVLAYSVVRVDFDQSHCVSFDFDDLKVSHDSFPCSCLRCV